MQYACGLRQSQTVGWKKMRCETLLHIGLERCFVYRVLYKK